MTVIPDRRHSPLALVVPLGSRRRDDPATDSPRWYVQLRARLALTVAEYPVTVMIWLVAAVAAAIAPNLR